MKGLYQQRFKYSVNRMILGKPKKMERVINWVILFLMVALGMILV